MNDIRNDLTMDNAALLTDDKVHVFSLRDFLSETRKFLDEYYRGCYQASTVNRKNTTVAIDTYGYASFLSRIFISARAGHLITVNAHVNSKKLILDISTDTSALDEKAKDELLKIAEDSGFYAEICGKNIIAPFPLLDSVCTAFQAVSSSFIYNMLKKVFLS